MKKIALVIALALCFGAPAAFADGGLAIGQDPYALAATKCANNGPGNDGEYLVKGECIKGVVAEDKLRSTPFPSPLSEIRPFPQF